MRLILLIGWITLEVVILGRVADALGALAVFALLLAGVIGGTALLRRQGLHTMNQIRQTLEQGEEPGLELLNALPGFAAGLLLILPGLMSDIVAAALLLGLGRRLLWPRAGSNRRHAARPSSTIIEGEYEEVEPGEAAEDQDRRLR